MHEILERRKHKNSRVESEQLLAENVFIFGTRTNNYNPLAILKIYEE
jgi:hypothetical protein